MTKETAYLGVYGLDLHDEVWIRTVIGVAIPRLQQQWRLTDVEHAQVVICRPDCLGQLHEQRDKVVLVSLLHQNERPIPGTPVLHAPIRTDPFLDLLNHCGETLRNGVEFDDAMRLQDREQANSGLLSLPAELEWIQALHTAMIAGSDAKISIAGKVRYIVRRSGRRLACVEDADQALSAGQLISQWCELSPEQWMAWRVHWCDTGSHADVETRSNPPVWWPLEKLLWNLAVAMVRDKRLPPLPDKVLYHLQRWPDFGVVRHTPHCLTLSAALVHASLPVEELMRRTGAEKSEIEYVLYAGLFGDLLVQERIVEQTDAGSRSNRLVKTGEAGSVKAGLSRLFGVIRNKLGLGSRTVDG